MVFFNSNFLLLGQEDYLTNWRCCPATSAVIKRLGVGTRYLNNCKSHLFGTFMIYFSFLNGTICDIFIYHCKLNFFISLVCRFKKTRRLGVWKCIMMGLKYMVSWSKDGTKKTKNSWRNTDMLLIIIVSLHVSTLQEHIWLKAISESHYCPTYVWNPLLILFHYWLSWTHGAVPLKSVLSPRGPLQKWNKSANQICDWTH